MSQLTLKSRILGHLANERRVVVADWRLFLIYARTAHAHGYALPDVGKAHRLIRDLLASHEMAPVAGVNGVFQITVPYASILPASPEAICQEASPLATLSYRSAMAYHELTDEMPNDIFLTHFKSSSSRLPLGTTPDDWVDAPKPRQRKPRTIVSTPIHWFQTKAQWDFGIMVGYMQGVPIYVTDLERTLLDALRFPENSGGAFETLRMWKRAATMVRADVLVDYVERFGQSLLRQRVGYLMEQLRLTHPFLQNWANDSRRGSSAKLVANRDFSRNYSERWNLSLNVPESYLSEICNVDD